MILSVSCLAVRNICLKTCTSRTLSQTPVPVEIQMMTERDRLEQMTEQGKAVSDFASQSDTFACRIDVPYADLIL
jgi:hypothetical protein